VERGEGLSSVRGLEDLVYWRMVSICWMPAKNKTDLFLKLIAVGCTKMIEILGNKSQVSHGYSDLRLDLVRDRIILRSGWRYHPLSIQRAFKYSLSL
jgi:hypothetical protein